jgi:hypothetical protein
MVNFQIGVSFLLMELSVMGISPLFYPLKKTEWFKVDRDGLHLFFGFTSMPKYSLESVRR